MKNFVLSFLLITLCTTMLFGQLKKGDLLLDFTAGSIIDKNNFQSSDAPKYSHFSNLNPTAGYMVNSHLMAGTGLYLYYVKNYSSTTGLFTGKTLEVSPFIRYYYLPENKLMPFIFINSNFSWESEDYERETEFYKSFNNLRISASTGMGINLFIANNLALEAYVGTPLFENKNVIEWNDLLVYNLGIRTLVNSWDNSVTDDLIKRYLRRGNFKIGGNTGFSLSPNYRYYGEGQLKFLAAPLEKKVNTELSMKYFTKSNLAFTFNPAYNFRNNGNTTVRSVQLGAGVEQYSLITGRLFFVPSFRFSARRQWSKYSIINTIFTTGAPTLDTMQIKYHQTYLTAGFSAAIKYFTKNKIIYNSGVELIFTNIYLNEITGRRNASGQQNIFLGLEYFFAPNLIAGVKLSHNISRRRVNSYQFAQLPYGQNNGKLLLSFSLDYFIFRN